MANLIDKTYFDNDLIIAGLNETHIAADLDAYIATYEPEFLRMLLGVSLYDAFIAGLAITPTVPARWLTLRDGVSYTIDNRSYHWAGFKNSTLKISPIANYVYWKYMRSQETLTTQAGEVKPKAENSSPVSNKFKVVRAWNQMVAWNHDLRHFLQNYLAPDNLTYPEYPADNWGLDYSIFIKTNVLGI